MRAARSMQGSSSNIAWARRIRWISRLALGNARPPKSYFRSDRFRLATLRRCLFRWSFRDAPLGADPESLAQTRNLEINTTRFRVRADARPGMTVHIK